MQTEAQREVVNSPRFGMKQQPGRIFMNTTASGVGTAEALLLSNSENHEQRVGSIATELSSLKFLADASDDR